MHARTQRPRIMLYVMNISSPHLLCISSHGLDQSMCSHATDTHKGEHIIIIYIMYIPREGRDTQRHTKLHREKRNARLGMRQRHLLPSCSRYVIMRSAPSILRTLWRQSDGSAFKLPRLSCTEFTNAETCRMPAIAAVRCNDNPSIGRHNATTDYQEQAVRTPR